MGRSSQFVCVSIGQGWSIRIQYSYFKTFEYRVWVLGVFIFVFE